MAKIFAINGPVIKSRDVLEFEMAEMVYVGKQGILGEVIALNQDIATIQIYESSTNLRVGDPIRTTGQALSVDMGPGLMGRIYDGIGRPLVHLKETYGSFLAAGQSSESIAKDKIWQVEFLLEEGSAVKTGQVLAQVEETKSITFRLLAEHDGIIKTAQSGSYKAYDDVVVYEDGSKQSLVTRWPIRNPRPILSRLSAKEPLVTGQRVIDTFFPIVKGGSAAIPGGFGAGKTMLQHQLAKWCDADIIVYIGCGERGNEMAQVLEEFSELIDPKTGHTMMERTILIANTSNMPVAAREASIYTGITYAEFYRDMGYHVALMADSTSRWAEALRELSGRLEEMPAEEGFPAYLASRLAQFYERSANVLTLNGDQGSISIIGAISPQGADFSEPVTQNTQRFIGAFWALDKNLAYIRHFPAINYNQSYSEYSIQLNPWYEEHMGEEFIQNRQRLMNLLNEENSLMEIVKLIGQEVLADAQKLTLEIARVIRVAYLQQNAFHAFDSSVSLEKQAKMMALILYTYDICKAMVNEKKTMSAIKETGVFELLITLKYEIDENLEEFDRYETLIAMRLKEVA